MKTLLMSCVVCAVLTATGADESQSDKEKLQGTWLLVSMQIDGRDGYDARQGMKWTFSGDKLIAAAKMDNEVKATTGAFTIDPSKDPRTIDVRFDAKITYKGIYKLEDGRLKVCYHAADRPTEATSRAGSRNVLMEFKSEKTR